MDVLEMQRLAFLMLKYGDEKGRESPPLGFVNITDFETEHHLSNGASFEIVGYLAEKSLIAIVDQSHKYIKVTAYGKDQLADSLRQPNVQTASFPSVNVLQIGVVHGGQIQQGTHHSSQTGTFTIGHTTADLTELLTKLREGLPTIQGLSDENRKEVEGYIEAIEKNLVLKHPKPGFIKSALDAVYNVLEIAAGDVTASVLLGLVRGYLKTHGVPV